MDVLPPPHDLPYWLRLSLTPHLGVHAYALLKAFGLPRDIFAQPTARLLAVVPPAMAETLHRPPSSDIAQAIETTQVWLRHADRHIVTLADPTYPPALLTLPDPPLLLYVRGHLAALQRAALAIVGARSATADGLDNARAFARTLAGSGWCVVSGLAQGIDAAAHGGAIEAGPQAAGTIAVMGTGVDLVYPARHRKLADAIAAHGALISELPLGSGPRKHHFPRRNRLIAGLSQGVLVVEAAVQSGSLITARLAADAGREVFAIPGSIHSPLARGCHVLIRQGAKLVETAEDILEELRAPDLFGRADRLVDARRTRIVEIGIDAQTDNVEDGAEDGDRRAVRSVKAPIDARSATRTDRADPLLAALGFDPVSIETLAARTGLDAASLSAQLITLELAGDVHALPGDRYQRRARR
ncbi:DNA-processing protein DprA [Alcaligenaceae bacterium B3P038]|nr:DNA-processing protein DprA [Alcaligenaceae bacterium B3P038]